MVLQLTKDEVLKVCQDCEHFRQLPHNMYCHAEETPRELKNVRKCQKWNDYFGGTCLFRG